MRRAPRLILAGLDLDSFANGEGNARRQSAVAMTRAANDAATTTRLMIIVCRMTIRAICQRGRVEAPATIAGAPPSTYRPGHPKSPPGPTKTYRGIRI